MKKTFPKWTLYLGLVVLYVLHNDLWLWNDPTLVLGLPVGLLYHFGFSVVTAVVMLLLVTYAWPEYLEVNAGEQEVLVASLSKRIAKSDETIQKSPSYWPALSFLFAAILIKILGFAMTLSKGSSNSFFNTGRELQRAAKIQGITDILMIFLGMVGVVLLARTVIRKKRAPNI